MIPLTRLYSNKTELSFFELEEQVVLNSTGTDKRNIVINLDLDYTMSVNQNWYYGYDDVLVRIGGDFAILWTMAYFISPFFVLLFLFNLASMIQFKYNKAYREELN